MLRDHGLKVAKGSTASTPEEAETIAKGFFAFSGESDLVVKAQVLAGGRGKGTFDNQFKGGIHICTSPEEVKSVASNMLGHRLITKQTGEKGKPCNLLYVCERKYIRRECYLAITMDREYQGPVIVASAEGGVDIETLAKEAPDKIIKEAVDLEKGVTEEQANRLAKVLGFSGRRAALAAHQIQKLYGIFWETDATLLEINPFAETADGEVICLDAKCNFDDNALFRHPEIAAMRDNTQEDPRDVAAFEHDLNYIGLSGNIACLVNGAGLAMATMDIIKLHGGSPANFLDVGGGASEKQVLEAFRILSSDPNVKGILVNIFGGIMRCDIIALGLVNAAKQLGMKVPIVVRLHGTNVEKGKQIIEQSGLRIIATSDLSEAADQVVKIVDIMELAEKVQLKVSFELPL
uniref:Succinate--CoA ligase [ADP-forming] subunit beta, mitochondrial n=1 Tax=Arcella intermedia TaxID=1963864 RepID=A0A6B2L565_9EUKA